MMDRLRGLGRLSRTPTGLDNDAATVPLFRGLRLFGADMLLSTGANLTLHYLRSRGTRKRYDRHSGSGEGRVREPERLGSAAAWVPLLVSAVACTVQTRHALKPSPRGQTATTLLNGAVIGLGVAGTADAIGAAIKGETPFSIAPLLFGYSGLLGFLLERQESVVATEEAALERRARIIERLVPQRRPRIDKIVVRV
jgi:hypothetical protein